MQQRQPSARVHPRIGGAADTSIFASTSEKDKSGVQRVIRLQGFALAALGVLALVAVLTPPDFFMSSRSYDMLGDSIAEESDEAVWNQTVKEIARFRKTGELPTFGLTEGRYYYMNSEMKSNAALRLRQLCKYDCTNNTKPPIELLRPGRLADGLSVRTVRLRLSRLSSSIEDVQIYNACR